MPRREREVKPLHHSPGERKREREREQERERERERTPSDVESRLRGGKNVEHAQLSHPIQSPTNIGGAYKAEGV